MNWKAQTLVVIAITLAGYCWGDGTARAFDEPEDVVNYAYSNWI